ncbi:hypothetical protein SEA_SCHIMMELS22_11 [Microbacterium phage Schimmels22]|nr:hypothetical protein SEA_SCHIMMELS22_11 [Microbacterium phage Schimmels22]
MTMSTQTLREAARLMEENLLLDQVQIFNVGEPVTVGHTVTRALSPVGQPVNGLVQSVSLEAPNEGRITQAFSIKVAVGTPLEIGQAVRLLNSRTEPALVGKTFLVDTVSLNGAATLRKATSIKVSSLDSQGKSVIV